ncbi:MAG TPA: YggS family pyridoxal phosphate-dependent enzyme [Candidatus Eisenbacteria bacterium]|nr:YggS family pyridoxal phosphate-dependent enzyme [Candidatus Eisenbacteria bacterium]
MEPLAERLAGIRVRMDSATERSGRAPGSVRLLAITKGFPASVVRQALEAGLTELGENRVQEAEGKIREVGPGPRWHLVGHLQTNKARKAVDLFEEVHSVDSAALAEELARRAEAAGRSPLCYVEVNTSGESSKHGVPSGEAMALLGRVRALDPLRLEGLMTIGPRHGGLDGARASFRALARLREEARDAGLLGGDAGLSIGMSDDFEIAIEEGATIVRIGSALFGPRGT